jgi:hypothetical protein
MVIKLYKCDDIWRFYFILSFFSFNGFHRAFSSIVFWRFLANKKRLIGNDYVNTSVKGLLCKWKKHVEFFMYLLEINYLKYGWNNISYYIMVPICSSTHVCISRNGCTIGQCWVVYIHNKGGLLLIDGGALIKLKMVVAILLMVGKIWGWLIMSWAMTPLLNLNMKGSKFNQLQMSLLK